MAEPLLSLQHVLLLLLVPLGPEFPRVMNTSLLCFLDAWFHPFPSPFTRPPPAEGESLWDRDHGLLTQA